MVGIDGLFEIVTVIAHSTIKLLIAIRASVRQLLEGFTVCMMLHDISLTIKLT